MTDRATPEGQVVPAGDRAVMVRCSSLAAVHEGRRLLLAPPLGGVVDVVPGWASLLVVAARPDPSLAERVASRLDRAIPAGAERGGLAAGVEGPATPGREGSVGDPAASVRPAQDVELAVVYDGDDLAAVAAEVGRSVGEVVARHSAATYTVAFLGFLAGFPYLAGLDPALHVPRLAVPRVRVPAGSVAIAGEQAGVYPAAAPGGWRLLGRTDAVLFDPSADPPALLSPGDRVRFVPVRAATTSGPALTRTAPNIPALDPNEVPRGPVVGVADPPAPRAGHGRASASPVGDGGTVVAPGGGRLVVRAAPPGCLVVDRGREGVAHVGMPRGGAFDAGALALALRLVGGPADAAALEVPLGGLAVEVLDRVAVLAVTGADVEVRVEGPGRSPVPVPSRAAVSLPPGRVLRLGPAVRGARAVVAVRGGLLTPPVLGSRSGLPVVAGDVLRVGTEADGDPWFDPVPPAAPDTWPVPLAVLAGPDGDRLPPGSLARLCATAWTVHPDSDRTGLRLRGAPLAPGAAVATIPSAGVLPGFVQVLPSGLPVVLGPDCGTTGGYPAVAVLAGRALDLAAQVLPGQEVRFHLARSGPGRSRA